MFTTTFVQLFSRVLVLLALAAVVNCSRARPRYVRRPVSNRVALVIGVSQYDYWGVLPNANRDATDVYNELRALGFSNRSVLLTTSPTENLTRQRILSVIEAFTSQLRAEDMVVFYFAGHGSSVGGAHDRDPHDYLLPQNFPGLNRLHRNFDLDETQDAAAARLLGGYAIDVREQVLARLSGAGSAVVFIDACRDQRILATLRASSDSETILGRMRGLSIERSEPKVHVLFSTAEGTGAFDGAQGRHSPFTGRLLHYLHERENLNIASLATEIQDDVREMTNGQQVPRYLAAADLPVYLVSGEVEVPAPQAVANIGASNGSCPVGMVFIPGGAFMAGNADYRPLRRVTLRSFCIDRTEVTVAAYRECPRGRCFEPDAYEATRGRWRAFCNWGRSDRDSHPVNCINWSSARAYCRWRGGDLPTEEQWEFAARGVSSRQYPWGDAPEPSPESANLCGSECAAHARSVGLSWGSIPDWTDAWETTAPVNELPSAGNTPEGLVGMAGNVAEYTLRSPGTTLAEASRPDETMRGGGWYVADPSVARASELYWSDMSIRHDAVGIRCAAEAR